jgi:hypothetical protein
MGFSISYFADWTEHGVAQAVRHIVSQTVGLAGYILAGRCYA